NFIPAQATARVTTFSFPLFILSGAPPGRLLASGTTFQQPPAPRKVILGKLPRPAVKQAVLVFLSGNPVAGCGGKHTRNAAKRQAYF
ncbi:MAG: hypothetical protein J6J97_05790, partial [Akkermansia sp.]|nr:hypothetical protein [Akkermansia sp.]